eukprot:1192515-Prorocentrum_minimum.AAC.5
MGMVSSLRVSRGASRENLRPQAPGEVKQAVSQSVGSVTVSGQERCVLRAPPPNPLTPHRHGGCSRLFPLERLS